MKLYFSGPFGFGLGLGSKSVDYSEFLSISYYYIVSPLISENDIWSFFGPLDYVIWLMILLSVLIVIMCLAMIQHPSIRQINWRVSVEFVLRNVLSESFGSYRRVNKNILNKKFYQKILIVIWIWSCFIIIKSYAGNLTAMISRPKLDFKFTKLEDFQNQEEMSLVVEDGIEVIDFMKQAPIDSPMRQIIEKTSRLEVGLETMWSSGCFTESTQYSGKHASICDIQAIMHLISSDFSENGKCNWYTIEDRFFPGILTIAFQVYC